MDWVIALVIAGVGCVLAANRSTWLVDYTVFIFVINRGLRRVVDYYINGAFNPLSPISLTPLVLSGLMFMVLFSNFERLTPFAKRFFQLFFLAYGMAFAMGILSVGIASVYALSESLAPLGIMGYVMVLNSNEAVKDRWIRSFSWMAIFASAYGWYQYMTIPPWDKYWLIATNMVGYMGIPEPTKMTVFSTMGERGVLAGFLGYSVVPMIVSKRWRTAMGWLGVVLVFSAILLTLSRGGLIIAGVSTLIFLLINKGANKGTIIVGGVILGLAASLGVSRMPNAERITDRFESLQNMQEDGSYQGRTEIMQNSVGTVAAHPFGYGLGASGMATRVNTGGVAVESMSVDGGYFDIFLTYGIPGTCLIIYGMWLVWRQLNQYFKVDMLRTEKILLARALMLSLLVTCFAGNFLTSFSILWLAMGCALSVSPENMYMLRHYIALTRTKAEAN
jgi:putative inorganic carbon (hco3(-)) transporter